MKKKWRWPLAGFALGAVVGATMLTVNVVGASSPERVAVRAAGFGEILHTPVLLARAGELPDRVLEILPVAGMLEPSDERTPQLSA